MKKAITVRAYNPRHIHQSIPYCGDNAFVNGLEVNKYKATSCYYLIKSSAHWCIDLRLVGNRNIVIIDQSIALIALGIIWQMGLFI